MRCSCSYHARTPSPFFYFQHPTDCAAFLSLLPQDALALKADSSSDDQNGLLTYMQGIGRENVESLTQDISEEVLEAMRVLIEGVLSDAGVAGESFTETSGLKLRELLVWQLVTGYTLRELERMEEKKAMEEDGE